MFVSRAGIYKMQAGKTLIRLLLQKHSDLGLQCLPRPFFGRQLVFVTLDHLPHYEYLYSFNPEKEGLLHLPFKEGCVD